jgi:hypothetical protein
MADPVASPHSAACWCGQAGRVFAVQSITADASQQAAAGQPGQGQGCRLRHKAFLRHVHAEADTPPAFQPRPSGHMCCIECSPRMAHALHFLRLLLWQLTAGALMVMGPDTVVGTRPHAGTASSALTGAPWPRQARPHNKALIYRPG